MKRQKKNTASVLGPKQLEELTKLLDKAAAVAGESPALTAIDKHRSAKLPVGAETVVSGLVEVCQKHGLDLPSYPVSDMAAQIQQYKDLQAVLAKLNAVQKVLEDRAFLAGGQAWSIATASYSTLHRIARGNGDIANALATAKQYFG